MPHWYPGGGPGWAGFAMMLLMAVLWILVLVGAVLLVRWMLERNGGRLAFAGGPPAESALEILQKRYARGEITAEQYREMRRELEGSG